MPAANAEADVYNPMTQADELIVEAVNIGLLQFHKAPDVKVKEAIRQFACRYGLLGLMAAIPTTPKFVDYEKVYLPKNPYIRQEVMETMDYLKLFFPFAMPSFTSRESNQFGRCLEMTKWRLRWYRHFSMILKRRQCLF